MRAEDYFRSLHTTILILPMRLVAEPGRVGQLPHRKKMRALQMPRHRHFRQFNIVKSAVWYKINTLKIFMETMEAICIIKPVYVPLYNGGIVRNGVNMCVWMVMLK